MASISVVTRPSKRADGREGIYLRFHHKDKTRYLSLGVHVAPSHFSDGSVRRSHPKHRRLNRVIEQARREAEDALFDLQEEGLRVTAGRIKERTEERLSPEEEKGDCFIEYAEELLKNWQGRWAYSTKKAYETALRHLEDYHEKPLPFSKVTADFCRGFHAFLAENKGNGANTRNKKISALKGLYSESLKAGVVEWGRNPFSAVTLKKETAKKEKLTIEELRRIRDLDLMEDSPLADVRRWFLFAYYAGGMRFSDVARLKRSHITEESGRPRVHYRMGKTKDMHGVRLVDEAVEILDYYRWREKEPDERIFPILEGYKIEGEEDLLAALNSRNIGANNRLKELARRAGIDKKVTFHLSRHALAGKLLEEGRTVRTIQKILGHSSVTVTEEYLRGFESSGPDEAMENIGL